MEFALPTALANQIVNYDPTLKKEAKARAARSRNGETKRRKSDHPLGKIGSLIPTHIVSKEDQAAAVSYINGAELEYRFKTFFTHKQLEDGTTDRKVCAILYHYESAWFAAWLPTDEDKSKYFYGFAVAFRNLSKASEKHASLGLSNPNYGNDFGCTYEVYDKKEYRVYKHEVTQQDIEKDQFTSECWRIPGIGAYYKKSHEIWHRCVKLFHTELLTNIPKWEDSYSNWERVNPRKNNYSTIIKENIHTLQVFPEDFVPSVESMLDILKPMPADSYLMSVEERQRMYSLAVSPEVYSIINTPFFRKWIQSQCDHVVERFNNPNTTRKSHVCVGINRIFRITKWISYVLNIWPDTPVDYFQTNVNALLTVPPPFLLGYNTSVSPTVSEWLRKHMPTASLFKILTKMTEEKHKAVEDMRMADVIAGRERTISYYFDSAMDMITVSEYENTLRDTLGMLERVLQHRKDHNMTELDPPKRWRIHEFHDYVQSESWKTTNPKVAIPQDLFPKPIKVKNNDKNWTFFQPVDTHQLAAWGQAVRNCVGSASNYVDGVKKKQHFIVLAMLDSAPRFTIQLKVNNGLMRVVQITDLCNKRLTSEKQDEYNSVFKMALDIRAKELVSNV